MFKLQMARFILALVGSLLLSEISKGQTVEQMFNLLDKRKPDSAILIAEEIISKNKDNPEAYFAIGRSKMMKGDLKKAMVYFAKVLTLANVPNSTKAWSTHDLGICFYYLGNYLEARNYFIKSAYLKSTINLRESTSLNYVKLGFHDIYNSWHHKETPHFNFHFQNSNFIDINKYITDKELAFRKINNFFLAKLPKKIDYYVWQDTENAAKLLKVPLAITDPTLCLTHTSPGHTLGHEITHSISFHAVQLTKKHKLITEGVCVYFDLSHTNNILLFKNADAPISIIRIWKNEQFIAEREMYFIGGQLVKKLIERHGKNKFLRLLADQSFENAKKIYGADLIEDISAIEKSINL